MLTPANPTFSLLVTEHAKIIDEFLSDPRATFYDTVPLAE
jgi:hypothetical protein